MADPINEHSSLNVQMKGGRKRNGTSTDSTPLGLGSSSSSTSRIPCGACKFLRKRCVDGCIFAPHFSPEQGTALFAAVHKIFGTSNVSKLLVQLPLHHRYFAVQTIVYEAQARLADPVCGCVSVIIDLYNQAASLQTKIAMAQNQLAERLMAANTHQDPLQQPEQWNDFELPPGHHLDMQPVYSHGSSALTNANTQQDPLQQPEQLNNFKLPTGHHLDMQPVYSHGSATSTNMNKFETNLHNLANDHQYAANSQQIFDPLGFTGPYFKYEVDDVDESGDPFAFDDQIF